MDLRHEGKNAAEKNVDFNAFLLWLISEILHRSWKIETVF